MAIKKVLAQPSREPALQEFAISLKNVENECRGKLEALKTQADAILLENNTKKDEIWRDIEKWVDDKGFVEGPASGQNMTVDLEADFLGILVPDEPNQFEKMLKDSLRR